MNKQEIFEELRKNVLKQVQGNNYTNQQIMTLIEKSFNNFAWHMEFRISFELCKWMGIR